MTTTQPGRAEQWLMDNFFMRPKHGLANPSITEFAREVDAEAAVKDALIDQLVIALEIVVELTGRKGWDFPVARAALAKAKETADV